MTDFALPGRDFAGTLDELPDAYVRLSVFRPGGMSGITAWLATYSPQAAAAVKAFEPRGQRVTEAINVSANANPA